MGIFNVVVLISAAAITLASVPNAISATAINLAAVPNVNGEDVSTLKLLFVLFRHGDRTIDATSTWPKDPHKDEKYFPYGVGQLTNEGKRTEYRLGKKLRKLYGSFLGNLYTPELLSALSTDYNRTKMSLELVLAGLFPPKGSCLEWERELNWQPIPFNYISFREDPLLSFPLFYCPKYISLFQDYAKSPEGRKVEAKYSPKYAYLSENSGLNVTSMMDAILLYFGLTSHNEWGFELPEWSDSVYPEFLENAAKDFYVFCTATAQLKQLTGGFLLKRIISDAQSKLDNNLVPHDRKLFLYSAHEINVAYLLRTIGVFSPHIPPYGACVLIEVHTINNIDGVKILYENYSGAEPVLLKVPGCDYFCPLKKFVKLMHNVLPVSDDECGKNSIYSYKPTDYQPLYFGL